MQHIDISVPELKLYGELELPDHHNGDIVLFSHGILSGIKESQRFRKIKTELHHQNISTVGFYFPGHGNRLNEKFTLLDSVRTLENGITYVRNLLPEIQISLLGVSLGSSIIPLVNKTFHSQLKSIVMFSLIPAPSVFSQFKFEEKHYLRWKTYGYSREHAEGMFLSIAEEDRVHHLSSLIHSRINSFNLPKLIVHGFNDNVTPLSEILPFIDQKSVLLCYSGQEGTHDLKGISLGCASKHVANWIKNVSK